MGFKVYFVSRSKLIKFLFSRLFCENFDRKFSVIFKVDRLQIIVVAKKYICVVTVHQYDA